VCMNRAARPLEVDDPVGLCPLHAHTRARLRFCPLPELPAELAEVSASVLGLDASLGDHQPGPTTPVRCRTTTTATTAAISATSQTGGPLRQAGSGSFWERVGIDVVSA